MATQEFTFKSIINSLSLPTLQDISIITLAIQLLEDEEVKKIYCEHFSAKLSKENLSDSSVSKLTFLCKSIQLPDILQAQVLRCFHWIRKQYFEWICYIVENLPKLKDIFPRKIDFITHVINSVKWKMGVIDKQNSVHQLFLLKDIKDDKILSEMFRLASRHCLEDKLRILWKKMSCDEKNLMVNDCKKSSYCVHYWTCKMRGNMREFMKDVSTNLKEEEYLEADMDLKDPNNYAFALHIFKGDISGVKFFKKLANVEIEHMVHIIRKFLKKLNVNDFSRYNSLQEFDWCAEKLHLLLSEIEDENTLKVIFHEFFKAFLVISVFHWPWHKFFLQFIGTWCDSVDEILFYDLMTQLVEDVKTEKADIFQLKMLWKKMPNKVKKSFCTYISNKQESRDVECLWKNMTIEVFDIFIKDKEFMKILSPYDNKHILGCICAEQYDLINFWLQKCLASEEAVISYLAYFIVTHFVSVITSFKGYELSNFNQFLQWAFKYEDYASKNVIFKVKDEAIKGNFIELFVDNLGDDKNWEYLKKLMDWMMRNRNHEYEDEFLNWKQKVFEKLFNQNCYFSNDFKNAVCAFLSYGVNDPGKIMIMMKKANLHEGYVCSDYLKWDFTLIDRYLRFLEGYGLDIFLTKESIFYYIFKNPVEIDFEDEEYWINIRKLLYWKCESDEEMKTKVEEIKKTIINIFALECILRCVRKKKEVTYMQYGERAVVSTLPGSNWSPNIVLNNILEFLFEKKIKDEEWSKMLFGLKMKVIEKLHCDDLWKGQAYDYDVISLLNWGGENENIRKGNWDIKKYFIEWLKKNIKAEIIPKLILNTNFVSSFLEGDDAWPDFNTILWDLKEFLVEKVLFDQIDVLTYPLSRNLIDFLKWNGFDEARIQDLKMKVIKKLDGVSWLKWEIYYYFLVSSLIKWGEENENIRKENWDLKKCYIEWLKKNIKTAIILPLISVTNFVPFSFAGDEARPDFKIILWDLKDFLVDKVISDDENVSVYQLVKNFDGVKNFLNWNGFDEARFQNFKIKFVVRLFLYNCKPGIPEKVVIKPSYFNWCIPENSNGDLTSNILNFKRGVLDTLLSKYSKDWNEEFFKLLDEFLLLHSTGDENDLKKTAVEKYGVKSCCRCLVDKNLMGLKAFMKWAEIESEESIENFKRDILIEFLDAEYDNCWKELQFWQDIYKFLCNDNTFCYSRSDIMKVRILTIYISPVFVKLLAEKDRNNLKLFLRWSFDEFLLPRGQKEIGAMFRNFGNEYCILMLMGSDLDGAAHFLNFSFRFMKGNKINKIWTFKKDCMNQVLINKTEEIECDNDWNPSLDCFWNCLNEFMLLGPSSSSSKNKILKYKDFIAEKYGILYMEKYFKCLLKDASIKFPESFLNWLFGINNRKSKTDLNEEKLFDFKKRVLRILVNVKHKDLWEKDYFYEILEEFLKFNLTTPNLNVIHDLKKRVCKVQGVELCYSWIHKSQWNEISSFLDWSFEEADCRKRKLEVIRKHGAEYCRARIVDDDWINLEKFLKWAFEFHEESIKREKEIIKLKTKTLKSNICYENHSDVMSSFLEWGFTSKADINKFKKSIFGKTYTVNFFKTKQKYKSRNADS